MKHTEKKYFRVPLILAAASILILLAIIILFAAPKGFSMPDKALRLFAEAFSNGCSICSGELFREATESLDPIIPPGRVIKPTAGFKKLKGLKKNEFVPAGGDTNRIYVKDGQTLYLPLLVFRFHVRTRHSGGILKRDYTPAVLARRFRALPVNGIFKGTVRIIRYRHGDGPSYTALRKRNIIVVHCRLLSLE